MKKEKILITGATGFIGSHLCELFSSKNFNIVAFDRYNINNDSGWLSTNTLRKKNIKLVLGDVRDYDSVYNSMKGCTSVIHLAALIGIPYSYVSPLAYVKTNVEGTYNVLEAARNLKLKNVIITSTSEVYGSAKYLPIDERHSLNAQSPYAASKIAADQLSLSYYKSFKLPVKIIRPFNTYGPRQSSRAIIPTIVNQLLFKNKKEIYLGNVKPTRDFTYVSDTCEAFFKVFKNKKLFGEIVNVGTNTKISIKDLAYKISNILKIKKKFIISDQRKRPKKSEVENLQCDFKKIQKFTKWKKKTKLTIGLTKTIKWLNLNQSKYKKDYSI
tara:strand:+ start:549 stop:1532 length:984 start_codon:yes stop_codon:yes gene_type:complete